MKSQKFIEFLSQLSQPLPPGWEQYFPPEVLKRGHECFRTGAVLSSERTPDGVVVARVQGPKSRPYHVEVEWGVDAELPYFDTACDCPDDYCEHAVAAILAVFGETVMSPEPETPAKPKLSQQWQKWLEQMQQAARPPGSRQEPELADQPERVAYVLSIEKSSPGFPNHVPQLAINLHIVRRLQKGDYGSGRSFYVDHALGGFERDAVRPIDVRIARKLKLIQPAGMAYGTNFLIGTEGASLLEEILSTGRCHWRGTGRKHPPLKLGKPRLAQLRWTSNESGMQSPGLAVTPAPTVILPLTPPWYVDEPAGTCGPLDTGLPPGVVEGWCNAPTVTPDQAEVLGEELSQRFPDLHVPPPQRIEVETISDLKPVPCLRLYSAVVEQQPYGYYYHRVRDPEELDVNLAHVEFEYGEIRVRPGAPGAFIEKFSDAKLRRIQRQTRQEIIQYAQLSALGFNEAMAVFSNYRLGKHQHDLTLADTTAWFHFCHNQVPRLEAEGWRITMDEDFRLRIADPEEWYLAAEAGSGIDWFGVELGVQLDGQKVNLLPVLLEYIQKNPRSLSEEGLAAMGAKDVLPIRLPDGRLLPFPAARLKQSLGVLLELFNPHALDGKGRLQLSKLRAAELSSMPGVTEWRWLGGSDLRDLSRKLHDFRGIQTVPPPPDFNAQLRPYQQDGLNWLQFLRDYSLGGILADDMGLGKTVQALAHLLHEKETGRMDCPSLVVAPTSLMTNWRQEAGRFAPALKLLVLHGLDRKQHFEKLRDYDLIVTSYPLLPRDQTVLLEQQFHCVILDEAQFIKNPKTQYAQIVCQLKARHPLCLTGTPMENHLGELWSLFNFLLPGFLGDEVRFRKVFRNPIEKGRSDERRKLLARRVAPFLLRRRKEDVVKELPPKTEIVQNVELASAQRDLYETIRLAMHAKVRAEVASKGMSRAHIIILDALLKLRQVCCDPRLLKVDAAKKVQDSAKLELLMDQLPEMISEGRRILLFSQFTSMLALIEQELAREKIDYVLLTGQTTDRATPINRFQNGEVPLFLISLKAGGTGLNLTAADTVIHYDPWWNPAVENQATDRAHRIGQDKPVFVYKLMTVGTVEERIFELQKRKRELVEGLLNEDRKDSVKLSHEDLDVLFAPIK